MWLAAGSGLCACDILHEAGNDTMTSAADLGKVTLVSTWVRLDTTVLRLAPSLVKEICVLESYDGVGNISAGETQDTWQCISFCQTTGGPVHTNVTIRDARGLGVNGRYLLSDA